MIEWPDFHPFPTLLEAAAAAQQAANERQISYRLLSPCTYDDNNHCAPYREGCERDPWFVTRIDPEEQPDGKLLHPD